ncbi:MAG: hypothetical protein IPJ41_16940 [Phycisphaerales bacterium]|nr:hypothetical protein [Phycisphaerales bacterium]
MRRGALVCAALTLGALGAGRCVAQSAFATRVLEYRPAPGQFVQEAGFDDPTAALGAPVGAGTGDGDETKLVTLGGFGGLIVLGFDHRVMDDPKHPLGLDFIVFGNAFWSGGNANRRWAEPGVVEVSLDANGNGLADDAWFLIPGSHLPDPPTAWRSQTWDDDASDPLYPPAYSWWVPPGEHGVWQTWAFRLPAHPFEDAILVENPNGPFATTEGVWGYADCSPTLVLGDLDGDGVVDAPGLPPERFYTVPDDPLTVGVDAGSGGGDAFDIAWAIDAGTGAPAQLRGIDFVRITNATNVVLGPFGERSAEVCGVAEVRALRSEGAGDRHDVRSVRRP